MAWFCVQGGNKIIIFNLKISRRQRRRGHDCDGRAQSGAAEEGVRVQLFPGLRAVRLHGM